MSKIVLTDVSSGFQLSKINENFQKIEDELNNKVLYRDAPTGEPNALENDLDANGKWILNVAGITLEGSQDLSEIVEEVAAIKVEIDATALEVEADKDAAQQALDDVVATKSEFDKLYLGSKSSDPTVDNEGAVLQEGSFYFNTSLSPRRLRVYNGVGWIDSVGYEITATTSIDAGLYASQAEAEAGINNTKVVTPLRTHQAATVVATSVATDIATDLIADAVADYLPLTGGTVSGVVNEAEGAAIASASTINLTTATGNFVHITGTTNISTVTLQQGARRIVVFDDVLSLVNSAGLILPSGANIITAAGDVAVFIGEGSSVTRCVLFMRASGRALIADSLSAATILSLLLTVDGASSGLDADLLDGNHASAFAAAIHSHSGYASTDLGAIGVGVMLPCSVTSGTVASGSTTTGTNLTNQGTLITTGTWRNIGKSAVSSGGSGTFQRIS